MTNPTDPAAVAREVLAKTWHDEGREELAKSIAKGTDSEWTKSGPAVKAMVSYGDQREKVAVEEIVQFLETGKTLYLEHGLAEFSNAYSEIIKALQTGAHKEVGDE